MPHVKVEELAKRMRAAIEAVPRERLPPSMSAFPAGSCGDASLLLGTYLVDSGISDFEYICGDRGSHVDNTWTSHAWLARGALIVDITADQFEDAPGKVIVSTESVWHRDFEAERGQPSDFRVWNGPGTYHLHTMYAVLRPALFS
jgi:hypothetical protein